MASTEEKCAWLKEHLVYEYEMLRFTTEMPTALATLRISVTIAVPSVRRKANRSARR